MRGIFVIAKQKDFVYKYLDWRLFIIIIIHSFTVQLVIVNTINVNIYYVSVHELLAAGQGTVVGGFD